MRSRGLVVLTDRWDPGWVAYLDGVPVRILRVDHALRGVVAPAGLHTLRFRYQPTSLIWGSIASGAACFAWFAWIGAVGWRRQSDAQPPVDSDESNVPATSPRNESSAARF